MLFLKYFIFLLILAKGTFAFSYDAFKANQLLIIKLNNVKESLAKKNPAWIGVSLRLADLLADQSRLCIVNNCKTSKIVRFRTQAIASYKKLLPFVKKDLRLAVYAQLGHLLQLANKNTAATKVYKKAVASGGSHLDLLNIKMALAQIYFKTGSYKKAIHYYNQVLVNPKFKKYNLATHKKSWALFRLGQIKQATKNLENLIVQIYKDQNSGLVKVDTHFYSELLKDIVLFYSYKPDRTLKKAKQLLVWTQKSNQVRYLMFFAQELERLGHLKSSTALWLFNLDYLNTNKDRIVTYQHITQNYYKRFLFKKASDTFSSLAVECQKNIQECKNQQVALKNLLVDWANLKKAKTLLLQNTILFTKLFPDSGEVVLLSAQLARALKKWPMAIALYRSIETKLKNKKLIFKNKKLSQLSVEYFLWTQIEVAELSKNPQILQTTYLHFINQSTDASKIFKIKYQSAVLLYEQQKYTTLMGDFFTSVQKRLAATQLTATQAKAGAQPATAPRSPIKINSTLVKSANLILQTLVKLKKDQDIEQWVNQYQHHSFAQTKSWSAYKRQALLNQAESISKQGRAKLAYNMLGKISVNQFNLKEKINYYYNQVSLLEKLKNTKQENLVLLKLLKLKKHLSKNQYQKLILRKIWLAELQLDFKTAFIYLNKLLDKHTSANRYLRLILFAKLSKNTLKFNSKYYSQFFKKEKSTEKKQALALDLLAESKFSLKVFNKYQKYLSKNQYQNSALKVLNQASLKTNKINTALLYQLIKSKKWDSNNHLFISRFKHISQEYKPWFAKISKHNIKVKTQYQISTGLKQRLRQIAKGEALLKKASKNKDDVLQMFYSLALSRQSFKLYTEILNLPVPKSLKPEELQPYTKALGEKAGIYKNKQEHYFKYYTQFWQHSNLLKSLNQKMELNLGVSFLLSQLIKELKTVAPKDFIKQIVNLERRLQKAKEQRSISSTDNAQSLQLSKLRQDVKEFPENKEYLKNLINAENKLANKTMSTYLSSRLLLLNTN